VQTRKITRFPIILFGSKYWGGLVDWLRDSLGGSGKIGPGDLGLLHVTDSVEELVQIILATAEAGNDTDAIGTEDQW